MRVCVGGLRRTFFSYLNFEQGEEEREQDLYTRRGVFKLLRAGKNNRKKPCSVPPCRAIFFLWKKKRGGGE